MASDTKTRVSRVGGPGSRLSLRSLLLLGLPIIGIITFGVFMAVETFMVTSSSVTLNAALSEEQVEVVSSVRFYSLGESPAGSSGSAQGTTCPGVEATSGGATITNGYTSGNLLYQVDIREPTATSWAQARYTGWTFTWVAS